MSRARALFATIAIATLSVAAPLYAMDFNAKDAQEEPAQNAATEQFRVWMANDSWHVSASTGDQAMHFKGSIRIDHGFYVPDTLDGLAPAVTLSKDKTRIEYDFTLKVHEQKGFHFKTLKVKGFDNATLKFLPAFGRGSTAPTPDKSRVFIGKRGLHPAGSEFMIEIY